VCCGSELPHRLQKWTGPSSFWFLWQKQDGALRLVMSIRRRGYWVSSHISLSSDGTEVSVRTPQCEGAVLQAKEKDDKMPAGATDAIVETCKAAGVWKWESGRFREQREVGRK
jgi:hypothetical protein